MRNYGSVFGHLKRCRFLSNSVRSDVFPKCLSIFVVGNLKQYLICESLAKLECTFILLRLVNCSSPWPKSIPIQYHHYFDSKQLFSERSARVRRYSQWN